jgi:predicted DCC family thiol-disulfide oxidoreductase YuxK
MEIQTYNSGLILFDGVCNFCNFWVNFLIKHDKKGFFRFASLQSEIGQQKLTVFGIPTNNFDTFIYIENSTVLIKSSATIKIAGKLGGIFRFFLFFSILPKKFRDSIYDIVARNRYRWFGKQESCMIPTPELKERFLS